MADFLEGVLPPMKFNVCTFHNAYGLGIDRLILRGLLESWGHEVYDVEIESSNGPLKVTADEIQDVDVNIFLELISPRLLDLNKAKQNWLIPNQEWFHVDWLSQLPRFSKILCKTQEAVRAFSIAGYVSRCTRIGWESRDLYDPSVPRKRQFLHVAGGSCSKNSMGSMYALLKYFSNKMTGGPWNTNRNVNAVLVADSDELRQFSESQNQGNCTCIRRASDEELKRLMNESIFHLMPSYAEGWGHVIHEGLGCGAVMITTDFPPMNEFAGIDKNLYARPSKEPFSMCAVGRGVWVGAYEVKLAIDAALSLIPERIREIQHNARAAFLAQRESFREALKGVIINDY